MEQNNRWHTAIQVIAFLKWNDAGRPEGQADHFWLIAEREFFEYYLPNYPNGLFPFLEGA